MVMEKEDFNEWYNEIIEKTGLIDKRYPIKGMNIWTPYGWKVMVNIDKLTKDEMERTEHGEVVFPLLIPETEFAKEEEHIKGFGSDVYWVTHAGENKLDINLLLRPTSETAMYPIFALWIRSHADLPLKIFQIVNVFRYETKQTRAFIRMREFHFFEAHTCHETNEEAEKQIEEDLIIMKNLCKKLCMPCLLLKRPDWDKFAGAYYSIGVDALMPTGRTMQIGGIHQYKQNFSKPYEIMYEDKNGEQQHVYQTTYGMSERLIGAIIGIHGDDKGVIFPPEIAPYQIIIVPIPIKDKKEEVIEESEKVKKELQKNGLRVHLDNRELHPGNKYNDWELKGVPLRIEIGPRDIKNNVITFARRDNFEKQTISRDELVEKSKQFLEDIAENLLKRAQMQYDNNIQTQDTLSTDVKKLIRIGWCGEKECGLQLEEELDMTMLGTNREKEDFTGKCQVCGKDTDLPAYFANTY